MCQTAAQKAPHHRRGDQHGGESKGSRQVRVARSVGSGEVRGAGFEFDIVVESPVFGAH